MKTKKGAFLHESYRTPSLLFYLLDHVIIRSLGPRPSTNKPIKVSSSLGHKPTKASKQQDDPMTMAPQSLLLWFLLLLCCHMTIMISHSFLLSRNPTKNLASIVSIQRWQDCHLTTTVYKPTPSRFSALCRKMSSSSSNVEQKTLAPGLHVSEMEVKKSRFIGYGQHCETWEEAQSCIEKIKMEHPKARHWCYGFQYGVNPVSERCSDDGEPTGTAGVPILGMFVYFPSGLSSRKADSCFEDEHHVGCINSTALTPCFGKFDAGGIKGEELSDVLCVVVRYFGKCADCFVRSSWFGELMSAFTVSLFYWAFLFIFFGICLVLTSAVIFFKGGIKLGAGGLIRAYGGAARQVLREAPVDILIPKSTFRVQVESSYVGSIYDSVAKVSGVTGGEEYDADANLSVTITCDLDVVDQLKTTLTDATRGSVTFVKD